MFLLISNHDNENIYFAKWVGKIKYLGPAHNNIQNIIRPANGGLLFKNNFSSF